MLDLNRLHDRAMHFFIFRMEKPMALCGALSVGGIVALVGHVPLFYMLWKIIGGLLGLDTRWLDHLDDEMLAYWWITVPSGVAIGYFIYWASVIHLRRRALRRLERWFF